MKNDWHLAIACAAVISGSLTIVPIATAQTGAGQRGAPAKAREVPRLPDGRPFEFVVEHTSGPGDSANERRSLPSSISRRAAAKRSSRIRTIAACR